MEPLDQPRFNIRPTIEQKPFENPAVQSFFAKWCEVNDSIEPKMVSRDDWEKRGTKGILEKKRGGKQTLYIPKDLQLWEMVGVMEVVDHDTFATKSERKDEAKKKLLELGKTFQNAGVYIAQRLDAIDQGKEIARALAQEFYGYGQSLTGGQKPGEPESIENIASHPLTGLEIATVDHFLAGDSLFRSRWARAGKTLQQNSGRVTEAGPDKKQDFYEIERRKSLAQFFRVSAKAFELKKKSEAGALQKHTTHSEFWRSDAPFHSAFLARVQKATVQKIETPKREFTTALFRRGLEKLVSEMRVKDHGWKDSVNSLFRRFGIDLHMEQTKLTNALNITQLKAELEAVREVDDTAKIAAKERQIADSIQQAVSGFSYRRGANNPSEMVANQYINCVGASMLGGALMREAGLNYLVGNLTEHSTTEHSVLLLVTSDGNIEWRDMLHASLKKDLTDVMIIGKRKDGLPLRIVDIVAFSKHPASEGLMFDFKNREQPLGVKEEQRKYVTVFESEYGQQIQVLNNTGKVLQKSGRYEEAIEVYRQAIAIAPKFVGLYNNLGNALQKSGRYEEAIEVYRQAIAIDPRYAYSYDGLNKALQSQSLRRSVLR